MQCLYNAGQFYPKDTLYIAHPFRSSKSGLCSIAVCATPYVISGYIGPHYGGTRLYMQHYQYGVDTLHRTMDDLVITTSHERYGVPNHQCSDCLFSSSFRLKPNKISKVQHYCPFVSGVHRSPADPRLKGPVMLKALPCHDVIPYYWSSIRKECTVKSLIQDAPNLKTIRLSWEWRCSWSSADRRCSNYIWVINN